MRSECRENRGNARLHFFRRTEQTGEMRFVCLGVLCGCGCVLCGCAPRIFIDYRAGFKRGGGDAATEAHMGPRCCGALHCTATRGAPTTAQNTDERAQKRIEGEPSAEGTTHIVQGGEPGGSHTRAKAQAHNAGQRRAGWSGPNSSVLWCGGAWRQCVRETSLWNREKMVWRGWMLVTARRQEEKQKGVPRREREGVSETHTHTRPHRDRERGRGRVNRGHNTQAKELKHCRGTTMKKGAHVHRRTRNI